MLINQDARLNIIVANAKSADLLGYLDNAKRINHLFF